MKRHKPLRNEAEKRFEELAEAYGWVVTKRGLPDFVCYKDERLILFEVKPTEDYKLKPQQQRLLKALAARGVECYLYSPDVGLSRIETP